MNYTAEQIISFTDAFRNKTLPKERWTHEMHVIAAFRFCYEFEEEKGLIEIREAIRNYNIAVGTVNTAHSGYHETITVFWMKLIRAWQYYCSRKEIASDVNRFLASPLSAKDLMFDFYSRGLLFSVQARTYFVKPDVKAFSKLDEYVLKSIGDHSQLNDKSFLWLFEICRLDPTLFTHEAHIRLAWLKIREAGVENASEDICRMLINYTNALGVRSKFNKTLTVAAVRAVWHFMQKENIDDFDLFVERFPRLKNDFRKLIDSHYGYDIFNNPMAKIEYMQPDLLPFT
ncbi:hypothetical protein [Pollutibacter soli]|uniref:hypothetical protein n=1 Tax=Pollutibacter soli TaxID=3034157 RepID=UPI003013809B